MGGEGYYLARELKDEKAKEARLARIEELENAVFEKAVGVVEGILDFRNVRHDQTEPPPEWIAEYGPEEAERRLALAKAGWLPPSVQPAGAQIALRAMAGIARGRNFRVKLTQNNLNVKLTLPAPTSSAHPGPVTYEVRDLET